MSDSNPAVSKKESASLARARGKARRFAMQAIYQWQMTGDDVSDIRQQFVETHALDSEDSVADTEYFLQLLSGVCASVSSLDPSLEKHMNRLMESVDPVERAILRIATYELVNRHDVPYRVVLNEAVNLSKKFCAQNSHTFVNGVLDKVAKNLRPLETQAG